MISVNVTTSQVSVTVSETNSRFSIALTTDKGDKGDPGRRGKAFTYEDFTQAQLDALGAELLKLLYISDDETSLGVGGKPDKNLKGYADVLLKALFRDSIYLPNEKSVYGQTAGGEFRRLLYLSTGNNVFLGHGSLYYNDGNTYICGMKLEHRVKTGSNNTEVAYKPYYEAGDSMAVNMSTAGYITNGSTEVYFTVPLEKPIVGTPAVAASTVNGFIFRQGSQYTHGSSGSKQVSPNSYTATLNGKNAVVIKAVFSNTTNATNNDSIGIHWNGKITFS